MQERLPQVPHQREKPETPANCKGSVITDSEFTLYETTRSDDELPLPSPRSAMRAGPFRFRAKITAARPHGNAAPTTCRRPEVKETNTPEQTTPITTDHRRSSLPLKEQCRVLIQHPNLQTSHPQPLAALYTTSPSRWWAMLPASKNIPDTCVLQDKRSERRLFHFMISTISPSHNFDLFQQ